VRGGEFIRGERGRVWCLFAAAYRCMMSHECYHHPISSHIMLVLCQQLSHAVSYCEMDSPVF
jgi:hypothetical protein